MSGKNYSKCTHCGKWEMDDVACGCEQLKEDTPRTNALLLKTFKGEVEHDGLAAIIDLARKLERELNEMNRAAVSRYRQICRITAMWREDIEECDKLKEYANTKKI